ncbi:MAG: hypothetical protein DMF82_12310 [Acidobacteria bacterium]|nr:MAG: hypothetical protein DMF82_12310 [Acidobacteriota bacterium]
MELLAIAAVRAGHPVLPRRRARDLQRERQAHAERLPRQRLERRRRQQRRQEHRALGHAQAPSEAHDRRQLHGRPGAEGRLRRQALPVGRHRDLQRDADDQPHGQLRLREGPLRGRAREVAGNRRLRPLAGHAQLGPGPARGVARQVTFTSENKIDGGLLARLEFRRDMADEPFFVKDGEKVKAQNTFTVGLVYAFGTKF